MRQHGPRQPVRPEKDRLELRARLVLGDALGRLEQGGPGVVDEDVDGDALGLEVVDDTRVVPVVEVQREPPPAFGLDLLD